MAKDTNKLASMSADELAAELRETKHAALNLRFRNATGQLENTAEISKTRNDLLRRKVAKLGAVGGFQHPRTLFGAQCVSWHRFGALPAIIATGFGTPTRDRKSVV